MIAYSQKAVSVEGDTLVCFSVPQSKYILKQFYLVAEKDTLLSISETQFRVCESQKILYQEQIKAYEQIISRNTEIVNNLNVISEQKDITIKELQKQIRKQKIRTAISIGCGVVTTAFVSYLWVTK